MRATALRTQAMWKPLTTEAQGRR